ncbi:MAG TPA: glutaredoxin family protein [Candidatus Dormibacteraeota bacterium]|nr:glutaredoxin family protein [Candidatus Dormibacteraeota bacterium]
MELGKAAQAPVEEASRHILEAFDRLGLARLGAADLTEAAADGAAARAALARLVEAECLRENLGKYERTEVGRLAVAGPLDLTLLSRAGCHLCEHALREIQPLAARFGAQVRVVDIDSDGALRDRYNIHVPVLFLGARELARLEIDPGEVQAALSKVARTK